MCQTVLELVGINKMISEYFSLKNINLDLKKGEVHAILGENGSGKSSLMNILCGYYPSDSGRIFIDGEYINLNSPMAAKRNGIIMLHQEPVLFEHFTIAENIFLDVKPYSNQKLKIIDFAKMFTKCQELLDTIGFSIDCRTLVRDLNPAEKRITEIAKAYISDAKILLMDEPTAAFSEYEASILFNIIKELKDSGISIFYITHKIEEIKQICDRVSVIRDGEIIGTKAVNNIDVSNIFFMMSGLDYKERYPKLHFKPGLESLKVSHLYSANSLKDISFTVQKKEIFGITGLIGSGGTRLAKCIFGIENVDSGEISINKNPVKLKGPWDAIDHGIGLIPEDRYVDGIFSYLQVLKNISSSSMSRVSNGLIINQKDEKDLVSSYINALHIKLGTIYDNAAHLSGGNQQKMLLAKWIMAKANIYIFDEPTRGIDIASKVDVYNIFNELTKKGASVIIISSDFDEILGMSDKIMVLNDGMVKGLFSRQECNKEKILNLATC